MKCPYCGSIEDGVVDSRERPDGEVIRRRRECAKCKKRFRTYERIEEMPCLVVKKDGRRELFSRQKVLTGLLKACEKRPISPSQIEAIAEAAEKHIRDLPEQKRATSEIGRLIMGRLK